MIAYHQSLISIIFFLLHPYSISISLSWNVVEYWWSWSSSFHPNKLRNVKPPQQHLNPAHWNLQTTKSGIGIWINQYQEYCQESGIFSRSSPTSPWILPQDFMKMTDSDEKFCLKWNDFRNTVSQSFGALRQEKDFFDVTLVSANYLLIPASYNQVLHIFGILKPYAIDW